MKTLLIPVVALALILSGCKASSSTAGDDGKASKNEKKDAQFEQMVALIEGGEFAYKVQSANPSGGRTIQITSSYTLEVKDGGYGDSDGFANGVIVDPGGIAASDGSSYTVTGSSSGCFIATAAFGSKFENHVQLLRRFRDLYLMPYKIGRIFVNAYYRCSPPVAKFITDHNILRALVRWSLIPLIGLSWILLHLGAVPTLLFLILTSSSLFFYYRKTRAGS
jgi:hypothetical protein